jgi:chemotaxis protein methyltransferase CheR
MTFSFGGDDFAYVKKLLWESTGAVLEDDKGYIIEARLGRVALDAGLPTIGALVARLRREQHGALHRHVLDALLNGETTFFRDAKVFEALRKTIIPRILARREAPRLQVWSAACSTGQEPYSVAMLLAEHFPLLLPPKTTILATDLNLRALARAQAGRFSQLDVNRGLPALMLVKHFEQDHETWLLHDSIRKRIEFREMNLISGRVPHAAFDIIFLRNVMIYWQRDHKLQVLRKMAQALRPDGTLVLGAAESLLDLETPFTPADGAPCCFRLRE